MGETYHLDGEFGDPGGDGTTDFTANDSLLHLYDIRGPLQSGDRVKCSNRIFEGGPYPDPLNGVEILQWEGRNPYFFWTCFKVLSWSGPVSGVYDASLLGVIPLINPGISLNWYNNWKGYLTSVGSLGACQGQLYSYFRDVGANKIHINIGALNPNQHEILAHMDDLDALSFSNGMNDSIVHDFSGGGCPGQDLVFGYAFKAVGERNIVYVRKLIDTGPHAIGFVTGTNKDNQIVIHPDAVFQGSNYNGSTQVIFHAIAGVSGDSNNICRGLSAETPGPISLQRIRDATNAYIGSALLFPAYSHTSGGAAKLNDVEFRDIKVIDDNGLVGFGFMNAADVNAPSDQEDWTTYNQRCQRVHLEKAGRVTMDPGISGGARSMSQCKLSMLGTSDNGIAFFHSWNTLLLSGCFIESLVDNSLFDVFGSNGAHLILQNCTVIMKTAVVAAQSIFFTPFGTAQVTCKRCLFAWKRGAGSTKSLGSGSPNLTMSECAYFGFTSTTGDASPLILSVNPFSDPSMDTGGNLTPAAQLLLKKPAPLGKNVIGVNGVPDAGIIGAYQSGEGLPYEQRFQQRQRLMSGLRGRR